MRGPSQEYKMQYLFLMEREFHELLSHEDLMNALTGQNKGQLERTGTQNNRAPLFFWDVDTSEHALESQLYQFAQIYLQFQK